eukprot:Selendium_serpulae@DN4909_c0_g1_i2.p1
MELIQWVVTTTVTFLGAVLASAAGTGGGSLYMPAYTILFGDVHKAVPLAKITILGLATSAFLINVRRKHPTSRRPLINFELATLLEPPTLAGAIVGVLMNVVMTPFEIVTCLVCVLSFTTYKTLQKGIAQYKEERAEEELFDDEEEEMDEASLQDDHKPDKIPEIVEMTPMTSQPDRWHSAVSGQESGSHSATSSRRRSLAHRHHDAYRPADALLNQYRLSMEVDRTPWNTAVPDSEFGSDARSARSHKSHEAEAPKSVTSPPPDGSQRQTTTTAPTDKGEADSHLLSPTHGDESERLLRDPNTPPPRESYSRRLPADVEAQLRKSPRPRGGKMGSISRDVMEADMMERRQSELLLAQDVSVPWRYILILVGMWAINSLVLSLCGGPPALLCGNTWQKGGIAGLLVFHFAYVAVFGYRLRSYRKQREAVGIWEAPVADGGLQWVNMRSLTWYPFLSFLAGVAAGCLGIGGGLIKGPLMLAIGLSPMSATTTATYMILFTASTNSLLYALLGRMEMYPSLWFYLVSFTAAVVGTLMIIYLMRHFKHESYVTFILAATIVISLFSMVSSSAFNYLHGDNKGHTLTLEDACEHLRHSGLHPFGH